MIPLTWLHTSAVGRGNGSGMSRKGEEEQGPASAAAPRDADQAFPIDKDGLGNL